MNKIDHISDKLNQHLKNNNQIICFGENINNGSYISKLSSCIKNTEGLIINVGNYELTHIGIGLGLLIDGKDSILFVKQLDFLLLSLDQIVNSYNLIKLKYTNLKNQFTIITYVCDQGYQGPQSSFNNLNDFYSMSNIPCYTLNSIGDVDNILMDKTDNFRILAISQKQSNQEFDTNYPLLNYEHALYQYSNGIDFTIISFNFSLNEATNILNKITNNGKSADLYFLHYSDKYNLEIFIKSVIKTKKLIIIDDTKSKCSYAYKISLLIIQSLNFIPQFLHIKRNEDMKKYLLVNNDNLNINDEIIEKFIL